MNTMDKQIIILGNSKAALQVAILAKKASYGVFVSSVELMPSAIKISLVAHQIQFEEGQNNPERLAQAHWIISENEGIQGAGHANVKYTSYVQALLELSPLPSILIIGERGKSSTAHLLSVLLQQLAYKVVIANLTADSLANALDDKGAEVLFIKAASSEFNSISNFSPELILWINQFEEETNESFINLLDEAKHSSRLIYNADDEEISRILNQKALVLNPEPFSMVFKRANRIEFPTQTYISDAGVLKEEPPIVFSLNANRGNHHTLNTIAACMAARYFQIPDLLIEQVLGTYKGLLHRMEYLPKVNSIQFINDATAYGLISAQNALESCEEPVVWITDGSIEEESAVFSDLVCRKVKAIINLGTNESIERQFGELVYSFHYANNITAAVKLAYSLAEKSDTVLYSPLTVKELVPFPIGVLGNQFKFAIDEHIRPFKNHGLEIHYSPERKIA